MFSITELYNAIKDDEVEVIRKSNDCVILKYNNFVCTFNHRNTILDGYYEIYDVTNNKHSNDYTRGEKYMKSSEYVMEFNIYTNVKDLHVNLEQYSSSDNVLLLNCTKEEFFHYSLENTVRFNYDEIPLVEGLYHLTREKYREKF